MQIAVIGATGFVGSHLVPHLAAQGHAVRAVSRSGARRPEWPDSVVAFAADVETGAGLAEALHGTDAIVHLVAIPRESKGRRFEAVNAGGVRRSVEAAREAGVHRFVHMSVLGVT
ncbi:MAG: NAD-dependent epimerase/dehydratase family protein, partial [Candidatus Limnocylindria bacterium]